MKILKSIIIGVTVFTCLIFTGERLLIAAPSNDVNSYVLLARDELNFKGGNDGAPYTRGYVLGGNVGVNIADSTPGNSDALLSVGVNGLFVMSPGTQLVGDSIRLGVESQVYDVYRNYELGVGWGATNPKLGGNTILGTKYTFTPPIINPWPTTEDLCGPFDPVGTTDITVTTGSGGNSPLTLAPGAYEDIQVQNGATLRLQAGVYTVRTFNTGQNVNVYTVPGTVIHIWGDGDPNASDFNLGGNGSYFGSENQLVESVACICVSDALNNVGGTANNNGIQFSDTGVFWGVIYAPGSSINLGRAFTHNGRFVGSTIGSDFNDNITHKECTPAPTTSSTTTVQPTTTTTVPPTTTTTTSVQPTTTTTMPVTAVELSSFTATACNRAVILKWQTETEIDNIGFNILRAESEYGDYIPINSAMIAAEGSATSGAAYKFVDTGLANRKTYYYILEDLDENGTITQHGPVSATPRLWALCGKYKLN